MSGPTVVLARLRRWPWWQRTEATRAMPPDDSLAGTIVRLRSEGCDDLLAALRARHAEPQALVNELGPEEPGRAGIPLSAEPQ